jgi:Icc-related predicted phosphoesterase
MKRVESFFMDRKRNLAATVILILLLLVSASVLFSYIVTNAVKAPQVASTNQQNTENQQTKEPDNNAVGTLIQDSSIQGASTTSTSGSTEKSAAVSTSTPVMAICSQPFLISQDSLPTTLSFAIYYSSPSKSPFNPSVLSVKLDDDTLALSDITYNSTTNLYDVNADLPYKETGKYMLTAYYDDKEAANFKGVNIYAYTGKFTFIQLTDIHYNPPYIGFENQFNTTIQLVKEEKPDFVLATGDITTQSSYQRFFSILKAYDFDIPMFFVNGNHEKETANGMNYANLYMCSLKTHFGNETPTAFDYGNYHFVGLDTGVFPFDSSGNISDAQHGWLENELKNNQGRQLITFCHHPLGYKGNPSNGWINVSVARSVMDLFSTYGVTANFAGHLHRSDVSTYKGVTYYTTVSAHNDTHWVGGSEPYPPGGFRVIKVVNESIVSAAVTETFSYYTGELVNNPTATPIIAPNEPQRPQPVMAPVLFYEKWGTPELF